MSISPLSCANEASYASRRARTITSTLRSALRSAGRIRVRPSSRSRLFRRLRSTTVRRCFGTSTPRRGRDTGEAAKKTSRCTVRFRFPRSNKPRISGEQCNRLARESRSLPSRRRGCSASGRAAPILAVLVLPADPHGEPLAAPLATPGQGLAPPPGLHASTEAMLVATLPVPGSVRGLHDVLPCPCVRAHATRLEHKK